ncbi:CRIB domain-containing protein RIC4-like [Bidens hawaiensis]|uniref:CRIB domain-containing protein RIC4-like n=1 Tax=Bidens hawaiensis TaxID=980011 RepID=UPI004049F50E
MKDRMERLVIFPFTAGCVNSSSVSVCIQHERRLKEHINSAGTVGRSLEVIKEAKGTSNDEMVKGMSKFPILSKPNIYIGFHRITQTIKSLSQSLVNKEDVDDQEMELEIGLPTNVKHVTHIGFDGPLTQVANGCNHLAFIDILSLCPDSMSRFEERAPVVPTNVTQDTQNTSCKSPEVKEK